MVKPKRLKKEIRLRLKFLPEFQQSGGGTGTLTNKYQTQREKEKSLVRFKFLLRTEYADKIWQATIYDHDNSVLFHQKFNQDGN